MRRSEGEGRRREAMCREGGSRGGGEKKKKWKKGKCGKERFIVERGWSILRRDSRAWRREEEVSDAE